MRIVLQRVKQASVSVDNAVVGKIDNGIVIFLGIHKNDTKQKADYLIKKCLGLRIFSDAQQKMNLSLLDVGGAVLIVSQFTLYGDCSKGNRPSFTEAAAPQLGRELYDYFVENMKVVCPEVATGIFGTMMDVDLINDGPVTLILDA